MVIKVLDKETNEVMALKSRVFLGDAIDEIKTGCILAPIRKYTHSIITPQEWAIVSTNVFLDGTIEGLPNWFDKHKDLNIINSRGLVFTMPLMSFTLKDAYSTLTSDEKRDILFELIIALESLKRLDMVHHDLHDENILLKQTKEIRSYTVNGIQYIVNSQYMPVIIDFAHAKIYPGASANDYYWDWLSLGMIFTRDIPSSVITIIYKSDNSVLFHDFFRPLRERSVNPESLVRIFAPLM